jgi:type VI secretion system secreted protein Hcp
MAGYVKLGSIVGESTEPKHSEWINLLAVSQDISRPIAAGASGSTRQRSSATLGDILLTKEVDKSTPKLAEAICKGTNFPKVEIHLCTSSEGGTRIPYFMYELKNVRVTDYNISGACDGGIPPSETLSLNYEEVKWTYDELDKENNSKGAVETSWKVEEGES